MCGCIFLSSTFDFVCNLNYVFLCIIIYFLIITYFVYKYYFCTSAWEVYIPSISIQHLAPTLSKHPLPPLLVPQGSWERAGARSCVGMAVGEISGAGPRATSGELHEFVMSAMLAMAHWTGENSGASEENTPTERHRDPGLPRLWSRRLPDPWTSRQTHTTDPSMRTRGRTAVIPSRPSTFMLRLFL